MKRLHARSPRRRTAGTIAAVIAGAMVVTTTAQQQQQQPPPLPTFEDTTGISLVLVDVVVRDSKGEVVRGLTAKDFSISEEGKAQKIESFIFQDIDANAKPLSDEVQLLDGLEAKLIEESKRAASATATASAAAVSAEAAAAADALNNRRMLVLLFDVSSMQQEDLERAADSGIKYVHEQMSESDLVAVVTIGSRLNVLNDFTSDREDLTMSLAALANPDLLATPSTTVETAATDAAAVAETATETNATTETDAFEEFNNDVRLRAIKTMCETLTPIQQKKAVLYFSSGMQRNGDDNQIEMRAATNTCNRGNVSIYPVDARGLQAMVAGGGATSRSSGGQGLFTGGNSMRTFTQLSASQGTLTTLAADTGGQAFTDSNDFGKAFTQVQRDLAAYYLIGYTSTYTKEDGSYRRIQVRLVNKPGMKIDMARDGYYARRDFANTGNRDREAILNDQLNAAVSSTDVPMIVGTGWFRQANDRFYVPIALVVPGSSIPVPQGAQKATLDVRGVVRDEQGRTIAPIRGTIEVPSGGADTLAGKQVLYQTSAILPPGRFWVKMVVRENTGGSIGSFESPIYIPQQRDGGLKVSSVVLSTQVQKASGKTDNPLVRDGVQLVPNLTRAVARNQPMYFYYEVYDPGVAEAAPHVRTSLAFYRGKVKVFETGIVEKVTIDEPNRRAVVFKFEVPADSFKPGTYEVQINVIDAVTPSVSFPRLSFMVL
jgi:VWFA-related protein